MKHKPSPWVPDSFGELPLMREILISITYYHIIPIKLTVLIKYFAFLEEALAMAWCIPAGAIKPRCNSIYSISNVLDYLIFYAWYYSTAQSFRLGGVGGGPMPKVGV